MKNMKMHLVILFAAAGSMLNAQSFKDMKKMAKESMSTKADTSGLKQVTVNAGDNAYVRCEAFLNSGKKFFTKTMYFASKNKVNGTVKQEATTSEQFFGTIKRDDQNRIINYNGYTPNETTFPLYYQGNGKAIYFIQNFAFVFRHYWADAAKAEEEFNSYGNGWMVDVYCADKGTLKSLNLDEAKNLMVKFLTEAGEGVKTARANEKAAADKAAAEKRAKYTTQNRNVVKLKLVQSETTCVQGKSYTFTIIAVLKDGTEISTANGGFADEYDVTATGLPATYAGSFGETKTVYGNGFTVPENAVVSGDKITITVKNKYYSSATASISYTMDYNNSVRCDYNAIGAYNQRGGNIRVEIKATKHGVTGAEILEYKVFGESGNLLRHFRINPGTQVSVENCGAKISGKGGTNGGDITIIIDPSVKSYTLNTRNTGGASGGAGYLPGSNGRVEKLNQKVTW